MDWITYISRSVTCQLSYTPRRSSRSPTSITEVPNSGLAHPQLIRIAASTKKKLNDATEAMNWALQNGSSASFIVASEDCILYFLAELHTLLNILEGSPMLVKESPICLSF